MNRRDHHVMVGHHVNRRSDLQDVDHRLLLDDRHRMGYLCVDDLKLGVSLVVNRGHHMNDRLGGHSMGVDRHDVLGDLRTNVTDDRDDLNLDVSLCHRMNDLLDDRNLDADLHDQKMVVSLDGSRGLHMNDLLDDHSMDDLMKDANHDHRMSAMGDRNDLKMGVSRVNRNYVRRDQKMVVMMGASRGHHMNGLLDDLKMGVSRVNRNCALRDRKMGENSDVKNLHVMYY